MIQKDSMIKRGNLPINLTKLCYIDDYEGNYCLFYKNVPMIVVNYQFWTEDIGVKADYLDYGEGEKGFSILIDVPTYDENKKLVHVDHVYYGLFDNLKEFQEWLKTPIFLY